jgi:hypothetical protein
MVRRGEWGARPPKRPYRYEPATHLAIHHTATAGPGAADSDRRCAAAVRAIQAFHMDVRGWNDIGYNYLVCQTGTIFQGREDGNPDRDVVAAHDGYNDGSVGTAGLGYFHPPERQRPSAALVGGFVDLFAWIAQRQQIDPEARSLYAGYGRPLRTVYRHRDVKATACPGDLFAPERPAIADRVDARIRLFPERTTVSETAPNPARDKVRLTLRLASRAPVTLRVYDLLGRLVEARRRQTLPAGTHVLRLETAGWAAGTYLYRVDLGARTEEGTLQIVR